MWCILDQSNSVPIQISLCTRYLAPSRCRAPSRSKQMSNNIDRSQATVIRVLDRHERGESARLIALSINCGKTQIQTIIKDKVGKDARKFISMVEPIYIEKLLLKTSDGNFIFNSNSYHINYTYEKSELAQDMFLLIIFFSNLKKKKEIIKRMTALVT